MTNNNLTWQSNPYAFGAYCAHLNVGGPSIAGISEINGKVRGYYRGKRVYDGCDLEEAKAACEKEHVSYTDFNKDYTF